MLVFVLATLIVALAFWVYRDWESDQAGSLAVVEAPILHQVAASVGIGSIAGLLAAVGFAIWVGATTVAASDDEED